MTVSVAEWQRRWRATTLPEKTYTTQQGRTVAAPAIKHTLVQLSTWANYDDGTDARPGIERLTVATGLSAQAVGRALEVGRRLGWIDRTGHKRGTRRADVYALTLPSEPE